MNKHKQPSTLDPRPSTSSDEVLVRVENVGKLFCRDLKKSLVYGLRDGLGDVVPGIGRHYDSEGQPILRKDEFWANQGISFELRRGECLGLIGKNGAGKTTLLKMLNGLIKPDVGRIEIRGRVGALIALGAGFNPILTGRENVFIAGSVLGLTKKEIETKYDDIVDFAELHDFMETPVQSYSSGMVVRLGFAVASAMHPDVLLVDEVLAVGDTAFKVRCYNRIREILPKTAVILVSHSMFDIARACNRVMVLKNGQSCFLGELEGGMHIYNDLNEDDSLDGERQFVIHRHNAVSCVEEITYSLRSEGVSSEIDFSCRIETKEPLGEVRTRFVFFDETQSAVAEWDSMLYEEPKEIGVGEFSISHRISNLRLKSGKYRMNVILTDPKNSGYFFGIEYGITVVIENKLTAGAPYKV